MDEEYEEYIEFGDFKVSDDRLFESFTDVPLVYNGTKFISVDDLPQVKKLLYLGSLDATHYLGYFLNAVNHIMIIVLAAVITVRCTKLGLEKTALHAYFCTLGYLCFFPIGIMINYSGNVIDWFDYSSSIICHSVFLFIGGAFGAYGAIHKFCFKPLHFKTRHGLFGLTATILFILNVILGTMTTVDDAMNLLSPVYYRMAHNAIGVVSFICAIISQLYGYDTGFFYREFINIYHIKICTAIIMVLTLIGPFQDLIWLLIEILVGNDLMQSMEYQIRNYL